MSKSFDKYQKRRLQTSYFSMVVSISLVLFLVGLLGYTLLKAKELSVYFKEKMVMTAFLNNNIKKHDLEVFVAELKKDPYVKATRYVSKKTAAKEYSKEIGEDFVNFLGMNPLKNAVDIHLNSQYVDEESMQKMEKKLMSRSIIYEVAYDKSLINSLTENIRRFTLGLLIFSGVFAFIAVLLINNSIRLSIYAKRFDIKNMQMAGATKGFIQRPFIFKSIRLGALGAVIAILVIALLLLYIHQLFPQLHLFSNYVNMCILGVGILGLGVFISWISTFFATQKFLNLRTEELY